MARDDFDDSEFDASLPIYLRGEMAVVAVPDACDDELDDVLPDTVPETRPLGMRQESPDGVERERAAVEEPEETAPPSA